MPAPGAAELTAGVPRIGLCAFLDVSGDPLRHALAPVPVVTPSTTILDAADPDFDNRTFTTLDPRFVRVSPIGHGFGGAEAVEFTVSGTLALDSGLMNAFSDPALFRGRTAKLWLVRFDANWAPTHARGIYSGLMAMPRFSVGADEQTITIRAENWLALLGSGAFGRTLLQQSDFDAGDLSAQATLGTANSNNALGPAYTGGGAFAGIYASNVRPF